MGLAIGFFILAIVCLLIALDGDSRFFAFLFLAFAISGAIRFFTYDDTPPPKEPMNVENCVDLNKDGVFNDCQEAVDKKDTKAEVKEPDPPKQEEQKEDEKKFDWNKWAKDIVTSNQIVACTPEGVQVYVSGTQNTDNPDAGPDALAVWPRLHRDGKPYTCEEGKDIKEDSSEDVKR